MVMETSEDAMLTAPPLERELRLRAANLRLVITDVDGTLTDGTVFYSEMKRFSLLDGMGVERLRDDGIETAFLTRETSAIVTRRAEKLKIPYVYQGVRDKRQALEGILADTRCLLSQVAYLGDDVNDLAILATIAKHGLVAAPLNAQPQVMQIVHRCCARPGGAGAFRDFAEWILELRQRARQRDDAFAPHLVDHDRMDEKGGLR